MEISPSFGKTAPHFWAEGFFTYFGSGVLARISGLDAGHLKLQPKRLMLGRPTVEASTKSSCLDTLVHRLNIYANKGL